MWFVYTRKHQELLGCASKPSINSPVASFILGIIITTDVFVIRFTHSVPNLARSIFEDKCFEGLDLIFRQNVGA